MDPPLPCSSSIGRRQLPLRFNNTATNIQTQNKPNLFQTVNHNHEHQLSIDSGLSTSYIRSWPNGYKIPPAATNYNDFNQSYHLSRSRTMPKQTSNENVLENHNPNFYIGDFSQNLDSMRSSAVFNNVSSSRQLPSMEKVVANNTNNHIIKPPDLNMNSNSIQNIQLAHQSNQYGDLKSNAKSIYSNQKSNMQPIQTSKIPSQTKTSFMMNNQSKIPMRKLPLVTPSGPKLIRPSTDQLFHTNTSNYNNVGLSSSNPYEEQIDTIPIDLSISNNNIELPINNTNHQQQQHTKTKQVSENINPARINLRKRNLKSQQFKQHQPIRTTEYQSSIEKTPRQLPIITKQGVLKLRELNNEYPSSINPNKVIKFHSNDLELVDFKMSKNDENRQIISYNKSKQNPLLDKKNIKKASNSYEPKEKSSLYYKDQQNVPSDIELDVAMDHYEINADEDDLVTDELIDGSDDFISSKSESIDIDERIISDDAIRIISNNDDEFNDYYEDSVQEQDEIEQQLEETNDDNVEGIDEDLVVNQVEIENEDEVEDEGDDEIVDEDEDLGEGKDIELENEIDEEDGEFYSALATVPEEDFKSNEKESLFYEQQLPNNFDTNTAFMKNILINDSQTNNDNNNLNNSKKLPTIEENGFEAQVLEYLAERSGIQRGELFSVDEEPSSYNDDANSKDDSPNSPISSEYNQNNQLVSDVSEKDMRLTNLNEIKNLDQFGNELDSISMKIGQEKLIQRSFENSRRRRGNNNMYEISKENIIEEEEAIDNARFLNNNDRGNTNTNNNNSNTQQSPNKNLMIIEEPELVQIPNENFNCIPLQDSNTSILTYDKNFIDGENRSQQNGQEIDFNDSQLLNRQVNIDGQEKVIEPNERSQYFQVPSEQGENDVNLTNYKLNESQLSEEDDRLLINQIDCENCLEQDEFDEEQYRDINYLEDLDRRATNHVHAIDGHTNQELENNDEDINIENDTNHLNEQNFDIINGQNIISKEEGENIYLNISQDRQTEQVFDDVKQDLQQDQFDEYEANLPKARIRWIKAFNKIVTGANEVSQTYLYLFE